MQVVGICDAVVYADQVASRFPIYLNGFMIGAVGVSGGSVDQDVQVSTAGVLGLGAKTSL